VPHWRGDDAHSHLATSTDSSAVLQALTPYCYHRVRPSGNMMLFDASGQIKRYSSPEEILAEFFDLRFDFYERRRVSLLQVRGPGRGSRTPRSVMAAPWAQVQRTPSWLPCASCRVGTAFPMHPASSRLASLPQWAGPRN
jgi:hypothetical protein